MAKDHLDRRPRRQTLVEIGDAEPAPVADPVAVRQLLRPLDRDGRDVDPPHRQAALGQPDRCRTGAARQIQHTTRRREGIDVRCEDVGQAG